MFGDSSSFDSENQSKSNISQIDKSLKSFEYSSEWADLISALARLIKAIQSLNRNSHIPRTSVIGKRLAQCVHPALPHGVHRKALECYDAIFHTLGPDRIPSYLPVYGPGLFTLLGPSAMTVKPPLFTVYEEHLLPICPQIKPAFIGLLKGLLPGLEPGAEFSQRGNQIIESFCRAADPIFFYTCLWKLLALFPSIRQYGIAFILSHFNKRKSLSSQRFIYGFDKQTMLSGLRSLLSDSVLLVQRDGLEFLQLALPIHEFSQMELTDSISPFPVSGVDQETSSVLNEADGLSLASQALGIVLRRDASLNRRLFVWLSGGQQIERDGRSVGLAKSVMDQLEESAKSHEDHDNRAESHEDLDKQAQHAYFNQFSREIVVNAMRRVIAQPQLLASSTSRQQSIDPVSLFQVKTMQDYIVSVRALAERPFRVASSLLDRLSAETSGQLLNQLLPSLVLLALNSQRLLRHLTTSSATDDDSPLSQLPPSPASFLLHNWQPPDPTSPRPVIDQSSNLTLSANVIQSDSFSSSQPPSEVLQMVGDFLLTKAMANRASCSNEASDQPTCADEAHTNTTDLPSPGASATTPGSNKPASLLAVVDRNLELEFSQSTRSFFANLNGQLLSQFALDQFAFHLSEASTPSSSLTLPQLCQAVSNLFFSSTSGDHGGGRRQSQLSVDSASLDHQHLPCFIARLIELVLAQKSLDQPEVRLDDLEHVMALIDTLIGRLKKHAHAEFDRIITSLGAVATPFLRPATDSTCFAYLVQLAPVIDAVRRLLTHVCVQWLNFDPPAMISVIGSLTSPPPPSSSQRSSSSSSQSTTDQLHFCLPDPTLAVNHDRLVGLFLQLCGILFDLSTIPIPVVESSTTSMDSSQQQTADNLLSCLQSDLISPDSPSSPIGQNNHRLPEWLVCLLYAALSSPLPPNKSVVNPSAYCAETAFNFKAVAMYTLIELIQLSASTNGWTESVSTPPSSSTFSPTTMMRLAFPVFTSRLLSYLHSRTSVFLSLGTTLWSCLTSSYSAFHDDTVNLLLRVCHLGPPASSSMAASSIGSQLESFIISHMLSPALTVRLESQQRYATLWNLLRPGCDPSLATCLTSTTDHFPAPASYSSVVANNHPLWSLAWRRLALKLTGRKSGDLFYSLSGKSAQMMSFYRCTLVLLDNLDCLSSTASCVDLLSTPSSIGSPSPSSSSSLLVQPCLNALSIGWAEHLLKTNQLYRLMAPLLAFLLHPSTARVSLKACLIQASHELKQQQQQLAASSKRSRANDEQDIDQLKSSHRFTPDQHQLSRWRNLVPNWSNLNGTTSDLRPPTMLPVNEHLLIHIQSYDAGQVVYALSRLRALANVNPLLFVQSLANSPVNAFKQSLFDLDLGSLLARHRRTLVGGNFYAASPKTDEIEFALKNQSSLLEVVINICLACLSSQLCCATNQLFDAAADQVKVSTATGEQGHCLFGIDEFRAHKQVQMTALELLTVVVEVFVEQRSSDLFGWSSTTVISPGRKNNKSRSPSGKGSKSRHSSTDANSLFEHTIQRTCILPAVLHCLSTSTQLVHWPSSAGKAKALKNTKLPICLRLLIVNQVNANLPVAFHLTYHRALIRLTQLCLQLKPWSDSSTPSSSNSLLWPVKRRYVDTPTSSLAQCPSQPILPDAKHQLAVWMRACSTLPSSVKHESLFRANCLSIHWPSTGAPPSTVVTPQKSSPESANVSLLCSQASMLADLIAIGLRSPVAESGFASCLDLHGDWFKFVIATLHAWGQFGPMLTRMVLAKLTASLNVLIDVERVTKMSDFVTSLPSNYMLTSIDTLRALCHGLLLPNLAQSNLNQSIAPRITGQPVSLARLADIRLLLARAQQQELDEDDLDGNEPIAEQSLDPLFYHASSTTTTSPSTPPPVSTNGNGGGLIGQSKDAGGESGGGDSQPIVAFAAKKSSTSSQGHQSTDSSSTVATATNKETTAKESSNSSVEFNEEVDGRQNKMTVIFTANRIQKSDDQSTVIDLDAKWMLQSRQEIVRALPSLFDCLASAWTAVDWSVASTSLLTNQREPFAATAPCHNQAGSSRLPFSYWTVLGHPSLLRLAIRQLLEPLGHLLPCMTLVNFALAWPGSLYDVDRGGLVAMATHANDSQSPLPLDALSPSRCDSAGASGGSQLPLTRGQANLLNLFTGWSPNESIAFGLLLSPTTFVNQCRQFIHQLPQSSDWSPPRAANSSPLTNQMANVKKSSSNWSLNTIDQKSSKTLLSIQLDLFHLFYAWLISPAGRIQLESPADMLILPLIRDLTYTPLIFGPNLTLSTSKDVISPALLFVLIKIFNEYLRMTSVVEKRDYRELQELCQRMLEATVSIVASGVQQSSWFRRGNQLSLHNVSSAPSLAHNCSTASLTKIKDNDARCVIAPAATLNLFSNREAEADLRASCLKKLAFIVYVSEQDQYYKAMPDLIERLTECLRLGQGMVPQVHQQIFIFARVLLARMTAINLTLLWPTVLTELATVMQSLNEAVKAMTASPSLLSRLEKQTNYQKQLNMYLSAAKFLATLLLVSEERTPQFSFYRWVFVTDIESKASSSDSPPIPDSKLFIPLLDETRRHFEKLPTFVDGESYKPPISLTPVNGCLQVLAKTKIASLIELAPFVFSLSQLSNSTSSYSTRGGDDDEESSTGWSKTLLSPPQSSSSPGTSSSPYIGLALEAGLVREFPESLPPH